MEILQLQGQRLKAILSLYFSKYNSEKNTGSCTDFEKELGYHNSHPGIRSLFRYLIEREIMIFYTEVIGIRHYYIDIKKLRKIIEEQEILNLHIKYIENVSLLWR